MLGGHHHFHFHAQDDLPEIHLGCTSPLPQPAACVCLFGGEKGLAFWKVDLPKNHHRYVEFTTCLAFGKSSSKGPCSASMILPGSVAGCIPVSLRSGLESLAEHPSLAHLSRLAHLIKLGLSGLPVYPLPRLEIRIKSSYKRILMAPSCRFIPLSPMVMFPSCGSSQAGSSQFSSPQRTPPRTLRPASGGASGGGGRSVQAPQHWGVPRTRSEVGRVFCGEQ